MATHENQILDAACKTDLPKKRGTFFISHDSKEALAKWRRENNITESWAIEEMIKATVPSQFFKEEK